MSTTVKALLIAQLSVCAGLSFAASPDYHAGIATAIITPTEQTWMGGYAARTKPADGTFHDLHATALVLRDTAGYTIAILNVETPNLPRALTDGVAADLRRRFGLARGQVVITCTHTHCGPLLIEPRTAVGYPLKPEQHDINKRYTENLRLKLIDTAATAIERLAPAELAFGLGRCGFAVNRRNNREAEAGTPGFVPVGPVDHDVPVLCVTMADATRAIVFGYACHCTTMDFQKWCGDYAGFARQYIESTKPGTTALFLPGCGADANPLPRRKLELCESYGKQLAASVNTVLAGNMKPIRGKFNAVYADLDLPFERLPTREEVQQKLASDKPAERRWAAVMLEKLDAEGSLPKSGTLPLQAFRLGDDLVHVFIGGETVVDYSLRLKSDLGRDRTWISSYANHLVAYIPSERVLKEGRYEGRDSMMNSGHPAAWAPGLEDKIVDRVTEMVHTLR